MTATTGRWFLPSGLSSLSWTVPKHLELACLTAPSCDCLLTCGGPCGGYNLLDVSVTSLFALARTVLSVQTPLDICYMRQ